MVKLIDAMVLWDKEHLDSDRGPAVKVVNHTTQDQVQDYRYLTYSAGACYKSWQHAAPLDRAAHVLALFNILTMRDGIPAEQVHTAFLEIDEYAEWRAGDMYTVNPFLELYWRAS